jgi:hypothetical protein
VWLSSGKRQSYEHYSLAFQGCKKAKTSNILPIGDGNGFIIASMSMVAGNHNDAFKLKPISKPPSEI